MNAKDFLLTRAPDKPDRLLEVPLEPLAGSKAGELAARLDLVPEVTPADA